MSVNRNTSGRERKYRVPSKRVVTRYVGTPRRRKVFQRPRVPGRIGGCGSRFGGRERRASTHPKPREREPVDNPVCGAVDGLWITNVPRRVFASCGCGASRRSKNFITKHADACDGPRAFFAAGREPVDKIQVLHKLYTDLSTSCGLFSKVGNAFDSQKTRAYNCKQSRKSLSYPG